MKSAASPAIDLSRKRPFSAILTSLGHCAAILVAGGAWAEAMVPGGDLPLKIDLKASNQVEIREAAKGEYDITTTGADPYVVFEEAGAFDAEKIHVLGFEYFCPDGIRNVMLFYGKPFSPERQMTGLALPKAEGWQPASINLKSAGGGDAFSSSHGALRLDLGMKAGARIRLRDAVLRAPLPSETRDAAEAARERERRLAEGTQVREYLGAKHPASISVVAVTKDEVEISGTLPPGLDSAHLAEIEPHERSWDAEAPRIVAEIAPGPDGTFQAKLPRFVDGRDRLAHRWMIVEKTAGGSPRALSLAKWPTDVSRAARREMPRHRPANQKGLGGLEWLPDIHGDFEDLGITAVTVNFMLPAQGVLAEPGSRGAVSYEHNGKTWWFNEDIFHRWDRQVKWHSDHGRVVSGILLISKSDPQLAHPQRDPAGLYAMPNLVSREATDLYRAWMSFAAERYSRPDRKFGHVTHWIIHNEVDYGWQWTNMGEQAMEIYLDTYIRSMRLVALEAAPWNPGADVFISLTHNWDYQPPEPLKYYAPRAMLDLLAEFSAAEGDFPWGVAYHPYPESLFNSATWNDKKATFAFDTRMITPRNLEVLDAYLRQPAFLRDGAMRPILLSEQGFHSTGYDGEAERLQAAGLVYVFEKLKHLPSVESYHYHRWIDHPREGGLLCGLRRLPEKDRPYGDPKFIYDVYRALGTPGESKASAFALPLIGIKSLDEIAADPKTVRETSP